MNDEKPIRAERKPVPFFEGLEVEGYRMPDGNYRVGIEGASLVVGYARNWLGRALSRGGKLLRLQFAYNKNEYNFGYRLLCRLLAF